MTTENTDKGQATTEADSQGHCALGDGSASVFCYCGETAIIGLHFTNFDHRKWIPNCERCYQTHLENAQDTNDHEMRHFGGAWGLVTWEERDVAGATQDPTDGSLSWPNAKIRGAQSAFPESTGWTPNFNPPKTMSNLMRKLRGTGRTTRMLEHAKKLARAGRAVYVIADNTRDMRRLEILCGEPNLGIKFETHDSPGNLVWEEMRLRGTHPNCVVLVDHHAIEDRFARVLEMLHAYDEPLAEESNDQ
jgi:hypothetical protein